MKRVRVEPIRHPVPRCESYDDEAAVRAFEREVRMHRAHAEPFELTPIDDRIDGAWRVTSSSGAAYVVDILDGTALHDTCTCPDYLTNDLGTCKHVEAVRRAARTLKPLRAQYAALAAAPSMPVLAVRACGGLALQPLGKWPHRLLASQGLVAENGLARLQPGSMLTAGTHERVRIVHAAIPAHERIMTLDAMERRGRAVSRAFESGKLGTDVLAEPLFPYQREGVVHLATGGRALLADDMGLGKTVQAIAACELMRRSGEAHRVLIVTPASLKDQWAREIKRYAGEQAVVVGGGPAYRREALLSDAPYKILNYELTWRELSHLQSLDADILVLDEAQRAKNFRTKTADTLRNIPSRFLFVLTGTPIENRLDDLYSLLQLIDPGRLGPLWKFNLDFHKQDVKGKITGYKNLSALRERIAPVVMRRRKEEVLLQLPPLTEQTRYTSLTEEQRRLEEEYRNKAARLMKMAERRALTKEEQELLMKLLVKARQACNAAELCDPKTHHKGSPKLDEFEALVSEIVSQGTSKVLVFSEWVEMLGLAAQRLERAGIGFETLHGGIPTDKRPSLLQRFREDPGLQVLLSSDAGGVGLNLQVASYVIHLDLPWNPGKLDQRTARAHRLGQTRGVSVTCLCAEEGIERGIEGTLQGKRAVREAALDPSSEVEELEAQSFAVFVRQLRKVFNAVQAPEEAVAIVQEEPAAIVPEQTEEPQAPPALPESVETPAQPARAGETPPATQRARAGAPSGSRAANRLLLAELVLREGFRSDAVRAAYDALASAVRGLAKDPIGNTHDALVAAIYRELLPSGSLPVAAHTTLAMLRDLTSLEDHGVELEEQMARQAVEDARKWVDRLEVRS
ncbi:MAG TPA: SNF2-related protein [Polyangiaceae bacterium]|nr:SNF2-related protein [Polyangiaceae bacterium]